MKYLDEEEKLDKNKKVYSTIFIPNSIKLNSDKIELYTIDNFLTHEECDKIIKMSQPYLVDSTTTTDTDSTTSLFRTSKTCHITSLSDCEKTYMNSIDDKISEVMKIDKNFSENIQLQYYSIGKEFKPHTDFFEPYSKEYETHAKQGNRTWTFMIYLNDVEKGGATHMVNLDTRFYPKKGKALIWNNLLENSEPNRDTLHGGEPPLKGEKYIITKWFREKSI